MRCSERSAAVEPFLAMELMERGLELARSGVDVVPLAVGEPDFEPPAEVVEATCRALRAGATHYTDSRGLLELRQAIADDHERRRGSSVRPDQVIVTSGTSPAMVMVFSLLLDPGDEVVMLTPHYPCYPNIVRACGGAPVLVPTRAEDGFVADVDRVRAALTKRTRAIIIGSPANPTGTVQPRDVVERLAALGVPIVSDEIYDELLYDGSRVVSPFGMTADCFVLDGFSKRFAMTGFRLGHVIAPSTVVRRLQSLQQNLFISTSQFVQEAGIVALTCSDHVQRMREHYARRRTLLVDGLRALGFGVTRPPAGAFYVFADARHLDTDSVALAHRILERAHVTVAPGRDFGVAGEGFLRFSFSTSHAHIEEGLRRLGEALPQLHAELAL